MLTENQIDYLFQIRKTTPPIPYGTVTVMLTALRWTPAEIEHAIAFLKRPDAKEELEEKKPEMPAIVAEPKPEVRIVSPIQIKQNPFPLGSPFTRKIKQQEVKRHRKLSLFGAVLGLIVFIVGVVLYAKYFV